jgi:NADPH:quinone reductase-like Zn-dependent oxidoreductase
MSERWQLERFGEPLVRTTTVPDTPGPGEVRLRMEAVSLNHRDLMMCAGTYDPRVPLPLVPCSDGAGIVEAVGPGVDTALLGTRQMPIFASSWLDGPPRAAHLRTTRGGPLPGTLQDHLVVPADAMVPVPTGWDSLRASTLPCAALTAWHALEVADVKAGDTVLCLGTGGVSIFALQLAIARGARVVITSSDAERRRRCEALGAALTVDYTADDQWGRTVARWAGEGVDAVIEVGGAGTIAQSVRATRVGGTVVLIGVLDGVAGEVPLVSVLMRSIRIQGLFVGSRAHLRQLAAAAADADLQPVVAATFGRAQVDQAFDRLSRGGQLGKVVLDLTREHV